ncbi:MAG: hypothetical protein AMJ62_08415 [Myxococcales bacterium SG8_38]|nr:MAG: hypothetical protein AMJ62_08415 [Myxococcales bacterium SG8_38]
MAKRVWLVAALAAAVGVLGALSIWSAGGPTPSSLLLPQTDVVAVAPAPRGVEWTPVDAHPAIREAVRGTDPARLRSALRDAGLSGLWVEVSPRGPWDPELPLGERFSAGGVVRGFRGEALTAEGLLYVIDDTKWPVVMADRVLGRAARSMLEGSPPPALEDFPPTLTKPQAVEVLVLLSSGRGPRLWRSARAASIAEGLITASLAARERWEERSETMGGPLGDRLDELDVEVALLFDDGTFDEGAISLIDALVKPVHGVAYEQPSRWRYLLPRATLAAGSATEAFERLFRDNGLPEDSFERRDLRLYRIRMETVSVNHGSTGSRRTDGPSEPSE